MIWAIFTILMFVVSTSMAEIHDLSDEKEHYIKGDASIDSPTRKLAYVVGVYPEWEEKIKEFKKEWGNKGEKYLKQPGVYIHGKPYQVNRRGDDITIMKYPGEIFNSVETSDSESYLDALQKMMTNKNAYLNSKFDENKDELPARNINNVKRVYNNQKANLLFGDGDKYEKLKNRRANKRRNYEEAEGISRRIKFFKTTFDPDTHDSLIDKALGSNKRDHNLKLDDKQNLLSSRIYNTDTIYQSKKNNTLGKNNEITNSRRANRRHNRRNFKENDDLSKIENRRNSETNEIHPTLVDEILRSVVINGRKNSKLDDNNENTSPKKTDRHKILYFGRRMPDIDDSFDNDNLAIKKYADEDLDERKFSNNRIIYHPIRNHFNDVYNEIKNNDNSKYLDSIEEFRKGMLHNRRQMRKNNRKLELNDGIVEFVGRNYNNGNNDLPAQKRRALDHPTPKKNSANLSFEIDGLDLEHRKLINKAKKTLARKLNNEGVDENFEFKRKQIEDFEDPI